jgi:hypothetical protein
VFGAGVTHLVGDPAHYGWNWDVAAEFDDTPMPPVTPKLAAIPGVDTVAQAATAPVSLGGRSIPALGLRSVRGPSVLTVIDGRAPVDGELDLGARTMRSLGVHIGSTVRARLRSGHVATMPVVGEVALPVLGQYSGQDNLELGAGAVTTVATLDRLADPTARYLLAGARRGLDGRTVLGPAALRRAGAGAMLDGIVTWQVRRPSDIIGLERVRQTPLLLAGVLAAIALAVIGHAALGSTRRRRRDLALLSALGFDRRQLRATVAWQATTFGVLAVLLGLIPGIAAGRWAWVVVARLIGAPDDTPLPAVALVLAAAGAIVLANVLAAVPARLASRVPAAEILHGE